MPRPRLPLPAGPAFALALALAPAVGAQLPPGSPVSWLPPAPTAGDLVVVSVSGAWRDSCVPALAEIHRDPDPADFPALYPPLEPPLAIASRWALVLEAAGEGCFSAVSPFHVDVALGPLPPGHNRVLVQVHDTFVTPPEDTLLDIADIPVGGSPETPPPRWPLRSHRLLA